MLMWVVMFWPSQKAGWTQMLVFLMMCISKWLLGIFLCMNQNIMIVSVFILLFLLDILILFLLFYIRRVYINWNVWTSFEGQLIDILVHDAVLFVYLVACTGTYFDFQSIWGALLFNSKNFKFNLKSHFKIKFFYFLGLILFFYLILRVTHYYCENVYIIMNFFTHFVIDFHNSYHLVKLLWKSMYIKYHHN